MLSVRRFALSCILGCAAVSGCAHDLPPLTHVEHVDVDRFMGPWYVIASIPTFVEKNAFNAIESYERRPDGRVQTTFRYRKGSFDGPLKTMHPIGTVHAEGAGAIWDMQFIWPIKAEYVIAYLDRDYQQTIVARSKRDYVWIMARTPQISAQDFDALVERVAALGYAPGNLRKVPQQWPEPAR
jgi:apolipoprotein D and lipocalin family protein